MSGQISVQRYKIRECLFGNDWLKIFVTDVGMFSGHAGGKNQRPEFLVYPNDNGPIDFGYEFPQVSAKVVTDRNTYKMPWGELRSSHSGDNLQLRLLLKRLGCEEDSEVVKSIEFHVRQKLERSLSFNT